jgi:hypothetical protein
MVEEAERAIVEEEQPAEETVVVEPVSEELIDESKKKTYMIKDQQGKIQIKNRN